MSFTMCILESRQDICKMIKLDGFNFHKMINVYIKNNVQKIYFNINIQK